MVVAARLFDVFDGNPDGSTRLVGTMFFKRFLRQFGFVAAACWLRSSGMFGTICFVETHGQVAQRCLHFWTQGLWSIDRSHSETVTGPIGGSDRNWDKLPSGFPRSASRCSGQRYEFARLGQKRDV